MTTVNVIPRFMQHGTVGVGALLVNNFLSIWGAHNSVGVAGFIADLDYGTRGSEFMRKYQAARGIEPDGGVGPITRRKMLGDGFDFEAALKLLPGTTVFVQPDGLKETYSIHAGRNT